MKLVPKQIGRYRILCELGRGAMAVIYLGRAIGPRNFERLFAIKTIHDHLEQEAAFVDMFLDEARLAARIHHPNVIPVFEVDVDQGSHFIAMEYVSGESLASALRETWSRGKPFPIQLAEHLVAEACEGLHAAHELKDGDGTPLGVVHRDVAPQNIMLGYDGAVRVMDFGIAKALDRVSSTRPGALKGTVAYMSPEQVRCEALDRRADVFSLGVVLWESTVGKRLFKSDNDLNTAARVLRMNIPPPSTLRENYPPELDGIIMRALERDRERRYPTARALGDALRDHLNRTGGRAAPAVIESFMKATFGPLYLERLEMEKKARDPEPENVTAPVFKTTEGSLEEVDVDVENVYEVLGQEAGGGIPSDFEPAPRPKQESTTIRFVAPRGAAAPRRSEVRRTIPLDDPDVGVFDTASVDPSLSRALGEGVLGRPLYLVAAFALGVVVLAWALRPTTDVESSALEVGVPAIPAPAPLSNTSPAEAPPEPARSPEPEATVQVPTAPALVSPETPSSSAMPLERTKRPPVRPKRSKVLVRGDEL